MTAKKKHPLPLDVQNVLNSVADQIAKSFVHVIGEIVEAYPGKLDLPNDAYVLLEMVIGNIFIRTDVAAGVEAKIMKALTKNVIQDMARYRLRVVKPGGSA